MQAEDAGLHLPVMVAEVLEALSIDEEGVYVDGTYGRGGHSRAILERLGSRGRLFALDRDPDAVDHARQQFSSDKRFTIVHASFEDLRAVSEREGLLGCVNGILLDLGVSSPQIDEASRGFSYVREGPLDMRFDPSCGESAATWLARVSEQELGRVLRELGEERFARRIARAIVQERVQEPICTTRRLSEVIAAAVPGYERGQHPSARTFQAIRIFINHELGALEHCLESVPQVLKTGGRLAVISFHSLEDRITKQRLRGSAGKAEIPRRLPLRYSEPQLPLRPIGKARFPTIAESAANRRARSAVLRVAERT
jgi:16S rRNA (cytosine1402-N4)-methyltransferase